MSESESVAKRHILDTLPHYISAKYAVVLSYLGYKSLDDLAKVPESHVSSIPGFNASCMRGIRLALYEHKLAFLDLPKVDLIPRIMQTMDHLAATGYFDDDDQKDAEIDDEVQKEPPKDKRVLDLLPSYIGDRYALLLSYLGYRSLEALAKVPEAHIAVLAGFGQPKLSKLRCALADHGLAFAEPAEADKASKLMQAMSHLIRTGRLDYKDQAGLKELKNWTYAEKPPHQAFQEAMAKQQLHGPYSKGKMSTLDMH